MPNRKTKSPVMAALSFELLSQDASGAFVPPKEFRIFPAGEFESHKGKFSFTAASAQRVMDMAGRYKNDYAIDYHHGMFAFLTADPAESAKAAGFFRPVVRDGELWATNVSWTPKATAKLSDREFRYISPAFDYDEKTGEIHSLRNVAITNIPAIFDLEPLLASWSSLGTPEEKEEAKPMKTLLALLGLGETASEAEAMAKLSQIQGLSTELLSMTGKASASDALTVVKAWKVAADGVPAMHAELSQLKQATVERERDQLITEGKRSGRVPPSYEAFLRTMELSQLKEFLKLAVPVHGEAGKETGGTTTTKVVTLSQEEKDIAAAIGVSEEAFAKSKAAKALIPVRKSEKEEAA